MRIEITKRAEDRPSTILNFQVMVPLVVVGFDVKDRPFCCLGNGVQTGDVLVRIPSPNTTAWAVLNATQGHVLNIDPNEMNKILVKVDDTVSKIEIVQNTRASS